MALESIALIPSGYKANKVYCQLPVDGSADLTTSRASGATRVNKNGLIEDVATGVPRLDYTNGSCPELLLEPQRRNLLPYSEDFTKTNWTSLSTATLSASTTIAPDGSLNAVKVTATSPSDQLAEVESVISGQTYTGSIWVRRVTGSGNISLIDVNNNFTIINPTSEWQRFSVTATATSTSGRLYVRISDAGDEIECWGAQLEDNGVLGGGDYMTSYIRTNGSAVTRIADAVTGVTGLSNEISSTQGVLYIEMRALADDGTNRIFGISDNLTFNESILLRYATTSNVITAQSRVGGSYTATINHTLSDATDTNKIAFKYKDSDFALWVNGVEIGTALSGAIPSTLDSYGFSFVGGNNFFGRIKDFKIYPTALTDAQLLELTS